MSFDCASQSLQCDAHMVTAAVELPREPGALMTFTAIEDSVRCAAFVPGITNEYRAERNARLEASSQGWQVADAVDRRDFCPLHVDANRPAMKVTG